MRENVDLSNLARETKCSLFFVPTPKFPEERIRLNVIPGCVPGLMFKRDPGSATAGKKILFKRNQQQCY